MTHDDKLQTHVLSALDGQNPLGFFAALGALRVLSETQDDTVLLSFQHGAQTVAELRCPLSLEEVVGRLAADAAGTAGAAALALAYDKSGTLCASTEATATLDLKPSPDSARQHLERCRESDRRSADLALAFFSELVQDNNGNTKPTSFHFAAGQQQWLDMGVKLRQSATADVLMEALIGPWRERAAPSLSWDATVARNYALRATDPSGEKRGSIPGANWLALVGLTYFPVHVRGGRLETTRVAGGWKDSEFVWPLWSTPIRRRTVQALMRGDPLELTGQQRVLMGITHVFGSRILRSDQGGYGSFAPADVRGPLQQVLPKRAHARR